MEVFRQLRLPLFSASARAPEAALCYGLRDEEESGRDSDRCKRRIGCDSALLEQIAERHRDDRPESSERQRNRSQYGTVDAAFTQRRARRAEPRKGYEQQKNRSPADQRAEHCGVESPRPGRQVDDLRLRDCDPQERVEGLLSRLQNQRNGKRECGRSDQEREQPSERESGRRGRRSELLSRYCCVLGPTLG